MSVFKNVAGYDVEVRVDGEPRFVPADGFLTVDDDFDYSFAEQPAWEKATKAAAKRADDNNTDEGNN